MTKARLLHALRRIGLNDEIVFARPMDDTGHDDEHAIRHAYVVTGMRGLVLVLAETPEVAGLYPDAETA